MSTTSNLKIGVNYLPNKIVVFVGTNHYAVPRSEERRIKIQELIKQCREENSTDALVAYLNIAEGLEKLTDGRFSYNKNTRQIFVEGLEEPFPTTMTDLLLKAIEDKDEYLEYLINFWKRALANPDKSVRNDLFEFINKKGHPILEDGTFIAYKKVMTGDNLVKSESGLSARQKSDRQQSFINSVTLKTAVDSLLEQARVQKKALSSFLVGYNFATKTFFITRSESRFQESGLLMIGYLDEIVEELKEDNQNVNNTFRAVDRINTILNKNQIELEVKDEEVVASNAEFYTDSYSRSMRIEIGVEQRIPREAVDPDRSRECSYGLHVGNMEYVASFSGTVTLAVVIDPADVIAIPRDYNGTKMRVCAYTPISILEKATAFNDSSFASVQEVTAILLTSRSYDDCCDDYDDIDDWLS